jgi:hypothetical protein
MNEDAIGQALHAKEETERQAEEARQQYVETYTTAPIAVWASAALAYAESANKAHVAAEHYEELAINSMSTPGATGD